MGYADPYANYYNMAPPPMFPPFGGGGGGHHGGGGGGGPAMNTPSRSVWVGNIHPGTFGYLLTIIQDGQISPVGTLEAVIFD